MKISKELFLSLKKADQIELIKRIDDERKKRYSGVGFWFLKISFMLCLVSLFLIPLWKIAFGIIGSIFISGLFHNIIFIFLVTSLLGAIIDFVNILIFDKKKEGIILEYFEIKKRKRNGKSSN